MGFLPVLFCFLATTAAVPLQGHEELKWRRIQEPSLEPASHESFKAMAAKAVKTNEFIFGGTKARLGLIPMQVDLYITRDDLPGKTFGCGGTLLSATHVLTAGHCTKHMVAPSRIMVGSISEKHNSTNTQWREIHGVHTHRGYSDSDRNVWDDIGVVEFSPPVTFSKDVKVTNILKDDAHLLSNSPWAIVSGFGTMNYTGKYGNESVLSPDLLYSDVKIYSYPYCAKAWWRNRLSAGQFCAGEKERGVGAGDSGGPLIVVDNHTIYQLGLTSYGAASPVVDQHMQDKVPSVFTRVSHYCDYLRQITRGAFECQ
ncbi:hypothetical protein QR680_014488 [Steinernema hermaphroditum]|uniref:Peptidase S1 domain-containing protein n=1 Tax=Steinernema hermaphroditum TaxID=289476 RepID=A0AA39IBP5_9BILA|nr:hypothetical protein QR680_014488 [Steinernema hermaphroditum]